MPKFADEEQLRKIASRFIEALEQKDYHTSDRLRDEIKGMGCDVMMYKDRVQIWYYRKKILHYKDGDSYTPEYIDINYLRREK